MKTGIYWQDPKYALKPGRDFIFDPSLVLYLPLYQLDGVSFMSRDGYGHLGTVTGALWTPRGRYFDGSDDKIVIPSATSLSPSDQITLEVWLNAPIPAADSEFLCKGWKTGELNTEHPYRMISVAGGVPRRIQFSSTNDTPVSTDLISDTQLPADEWHHIVGTITATAMTLYFNGLFEKTVAYTNPIGINTADLWLGARNANGSGANWYKGSLGEVRIYNRALTPLEIQRNYLATKWRYQ